MRTVTIRTIFHAITRLRGYDPANDSLSAAQKAAIAELVNERVIEGWEHALWPELLLVEQREYRPTYDATLNYSEDAEVFYENDDGEGAYYISLVDNNSGNTPDYDADTDYWAKVGDDFLRTIWFDQDGETAIGGVDANECIFDRDPRVYPSTKPIEPVEVYNDYILVKADEAPLQPYVRFRPLPPEFSWTAWSAATEYGVGDLVYLESYDATTVGETFRALASSTNQNPYTATDYWEPIYFPRFLKTFVLHAVAADQMQEDEGRYKEEGKAQAELERLVDTLIDQQAMNRRACFRRS